MVSLDNSTELFFIHLVGLYKCTTFLNNGSIFVRHVLLKWEAMYILGSSAVFEAYINLL